MLYFHEQADSNCGLLDIDHVPGGGDKRYCSLCIHYGHYDWNNIFGFLKDFLHTVWLLCRTWYMTV